MSIERWFRSTHTRNLACERKSGSDCEGRRWGGRGEASRPHHLVWREDPAEPVGDALRRRDVLPDVSPQLLDQGRDFALELAVGLDRVLLAGELADLLAAGGRERCLGVEGDEQRRKEAGEV